MITSKCYGCDKWVQTFSYKVSKVWRCNVWCNMLTKVDKTVLYNVCTCFKGNQRQLSCRHFDRTHLSFRYVTTFLSGGLIGNPGWNPYVTETWTTACLLPRETQSSRVTWGAAAIAVSSVAPLGEHAQCRWETHGHTGARESHSGGILQPEYLLCD